MQLNNIGQNIKRFIPKILLEERGMLLILLIASLGIAIQMIVHGPSGYNNYIIFKTSFSHLLNDQNLYRYYPDEYNDLYLYSPAFALLMGPFTLLPLWLQVIAWCCLSAFCVYMAIKLLPFSTGSKRVAMCWFILAEYITTMQNMQVAAMVASFVILSFCFFEKGKLFNAAFFIILATFIKIYAIIAVVLFLMYPGRLKFVGYMFFWGILFLLAPFFVNSIDQALFQYHSWLNLILSIHQGEESGLNPNIPIPLSVMGWLKTWFNINPPYLLMQLAGTVLLCLPFIRVKFFKDLNFRLFILASILIWSMIFNHIAESASYIVAIMGVAIWFVTDKKDGLTITLAITIFILSEMSPSSLFPRYIREHFVQPYVLKAVPCIVLWFLIQYKLLTGKYGNSMPIESLQG